MMGSMPGYSAEEIRAFIHEYALVPRGQKSAWLEERGIKKSQLYRWRKTMYFGDLDRGLVPRDDGIMVKDEQGRTAYERAHARQVANYEAEIERLKAENAQLEGANDALGKAIGLLHQLNVQEPVTDQTKPVETSSPSKTDSSET